MRARIRFLSCGFLLTIALAAWAPPALACQCMSRPACQSLSPGDNVEVFVGVAVTRESRTEELFLETTTFQVTEALHGEFGKTVEVNGYGNNCDYRFEPGQEYIVFATREEGILKTNRCAGTDLAKDEAAVIRQLRTLRANAPSLDIFGRIGKPPKDVSRQALLEIVPAPDQTVTATATADSKQYRTETRSDGTYGFTALPPGEYTVSLEFPERAPFKVDKEVHTVEIGQSCHVDLRVSHASEVRGVIVDRSGLVLPDNRLSGYLTLYKVGTDPGDSFTSRGFFGGVFSLEGVPPGRYHFSYSPVLEDRPDVAVRIDFSAIVEVKEGALIDNIRLTLP